MTDLRLRKVAAGTALVIAAPLSLLSWILAPISMNEGAGFVQQLGELDAATANWSLFTGIVFFPAAVIATLGLMHLLRDRHGTLATASGGLAITGLVLNTTALGAGIALSEVVFSDLDTAAQVAIVDATITSPGWLVPIIGVGLAAIGFLGLGIALYRAGTAPKFSALSLIAYGPVQLIGFGAENAPIIAVSYALMALALIPIGVAMFAETDRTWEHPAVFRGLRHTLSTR